MSSFPRRADLVFKSKNLGTEIQLDKLRACNLDEAHAAKNEGKNDFYVTGIILDIGNFINTEKELDGWKGKNDPLTFRQSLVLKDVSKKQSKCGTDSFRVVLLGSYAKDLKLLTPQVEEFLTIVNPHVHRRRKKVPFTEDDNLHELQISIGHNGLRSKVCVHTDPPDVPPKKVTPAAMVREIEMAAKPKVQYHSLKDCQNTRIRYNTWGVITNITRLPEPTKAGDKMMGTVYIEDPESEGTFGHRNYQFSIIIPCKDPFPPIEAYSILRIHHMVPQNYQGGLTFRVYHSNCVTVFQGGVGDPIVPICSKKDADFEFGDYDKDKVEQLRAWWASESRKRGAVDENGLTQRMTQDLTDINPLKSPFNLACKVLQVFRSEDSAKNGIVVTDGKKLQQLPLLWHDGNIVQSDNSVTIFLKPSEKQTCIPNEGDYVHILEIHCVPHENAHKLECEFAPHQVQTLPKEHSRYKEIVRALENKDKNQDFSVSQNTLMGLLAPIDSETFASQSDSQQFATQSDARVSIYAANMESLELNETNQKTTQGSQDEESNDGYSEQFFTCPEGKERFSPSPEREVHYLVGTNTNFAWTSIEELSSQKDDESVTSFRVRGYVREVSLSRNWKQCLAIICAHCCMIRNFIPDKIECVDCKKKYVVIFHFDLVLEENEPGPLVKATPKMRLFLAGKHAEVLLDVKAQEFIDDSTKRKEALEKMKGLIDAPVTFSINRVKEMNKNYGYQVVNSFFMAN